MSKANQQFVVQDSEGTYQWLAGLRRPVVEKARRKKKTSDECGESTDDGKRIILIGDKTAFRETGT